MNKKLLYFFTARTTGKILIGLRFRQNPRKGLYEKLGTALRPRHNT